MLNPSLSSKLLRPSLRDRALLGGIDGIRYLLYDAFTDTRAAGAVNGTPATPGPGTRTVVDTTSKLSIGSGVANFTPNATANPGLWYAAQTRSFGRTLLWEVNKAAGAQDFACGWGINQSSFPNGSGVAACYFNTVGSIVFQDSTTSYTVGAYSNSTAYRFAVTLRPTGSYLFVKGGAFTNWTLLGVGSAGNVATLYPVAVDVAATFTLDNMHVPVLLFTVLVLAYDSFTRANGALGSSETSGPDAQAVTAWAWTVQDGTIAIVSNAASLTILGGDLLGIATLNAGVADVLANVNVTRTLGSGGLVLRYVDANNYLRATHDGTNCLLEQVVAGTPTTLRTGVATYSAGATLRVILSGTTGLLFYNNAAVGASFTVPASSATAHGLYGSDLSCLWDNFTVMPRGTGNEYAGLDAL